MRPTPRAARRRTLSHPDSATIAILVNPKAAAVGSETVRELTEGARAVGLDAKVIGTQSPEEMGAIVRRLVGEGAPRVAVAGGDGTVACAARELARTETALGIIPQGTANNFATALRLPFDLPSALRILRDGAVREVDLGRIGTHLFTEAAGVGLFADALAHYGRGSEARLLRGLYSLARVLLSLKAKRLRLSIDGEPFRELSVMCTIANTNRIALADPVAPEAEITDGLLDIIVIGDLSRWELITYYRAIKAQAHLDLPKVKSLKGKEVRIEARRPMNVHCDDRVIGTTPATIAVEPGALRVLVDRR